jgi:hypothetical protein
MEEKMTGEVIGFTGTQRGMTAAQKKVFQGMISLYQPSGFHHGDCIGADAQAHDIVTEIIGFGIITIHPPIDNRKRAYKKGYKIEEEKSYLDRNMDIVMASDILIATPKDYEEKVRSGTWATIRYANKARLKTIIIYPDGSLG